MDSARRLRTMTSRTFGGPNRVYAVGLLIGLVVLASVAVAPASATGSNVPTEDSAFIVALDDDGDATVTLRFPVDVVGSVDREAVERIEANRSGLADQFGDRLARVADRIEAETGRSMRVSAASIEVSAGNSTVVVELSASWEGLAAVDGDRLVVAEPFASGFEPDRRFVLLVPEGYELASTTPTPDERSAGVAIWSAGARLEGFHVELAPEGGADGGETAGGPMPGFGTAAALASVLLVGVLGRFARRR